MNRDDILAKARKENNGVDEVKQSVDKEANRLSLSVGMCACLIFNLLEAIFLETDIIGHVCWTIYGIMAATKLWVYAIRMKKVFYFIGAALLTFIIVTIIVTACVAYSSGDLYA